MQNQIVIIPWIGQRATLRTNLYLFLSYTLSFPMLGTFECRITGSKEVWPPLYRRLPFMILIHSLFAYYATSYPLIPLLLVPGLPILSFSLWGLIYWSLNKSGLDFPWISYWEMSWFPIVFWGHVLSFILGFLNYALLKSFTRTTSSIESYLLCLLLELCAIVMIMVYYSKEEEPTPES